MHNYIACFMKSIWSESKSARTWVSKFPVEQWIFVPSLLHAFCETPYDPGPAGGYTCRCSLSDYRSTVFAPSLYSSLFTKEKKTIVRGNRQTAGDCKYATYPPKCHSCWCCTEKESGPIKDLICPGPASRLAGSSFDPSAWYSQIYYYIYVYARPLATSCSSTHVRRDRESGWGLVYQLLFHIHTYTNQSSPQSKRERPLHIRVPHRCSRRTTVEDTTTWAPGTV